MSSMPRASVHVQGTADSQSRFLHDVCIDHGGSHVPVSEQLLDRADIVSFFQEVGRERMSERVGASVLQWGDFSYGVFQGALDRAIVDMVAAQFPGNRVSGGFGCAEEVLPGEFFSRVGVFGCEAVWEVDFSVAVADIDFVLDGDMFDMESKVFFEFSWKGYCAVFISFSAVDGNEVAVEVDIGDPEFEAFFESEAGAIEEARDEFGDAFQVIEDCRDFCAGKDSWDAFWAVSADDIRDSTEVFLDDFAIEEQDCIEGLILG